MMLARVIILVVASVVQTDRRDTGKSVERAKPLHAKHTTRTVRIVERAWDGHVVIVLGTVLVI
jgi:hypothetical protein